jgi:hypothetical protein
VARFARATARVQAPDRERPAHPDRYAGAAAAALAVLRRGYHRVPEGDPPDRDWWTHRAQTFDVTHTEGLFILDPRGHWRALVPGIADLGGRLPPR